MCSRLAGEAHHSSSESSRVQPRFGRAAPDRARAMAPGLQTGVTPMVRRRISAGVIEALERLVVALWFAAVLVLLYLTLRTQLMR
jgi:hypothetical protein